VLNSQSDSRYSPFLTRVYRDPCVGAAYCCPDDNSLTIDFRKLSALPPSDIIPLIGAVLVHEKIKYMQPVGSNLNIAYLSRQNVDTLFRKSFNKEVATKILKRETAADIIHISSGPLQEGLCAYLHSVVNSPSAHSEFARDPEYVRERKLLELLGPNDTTLPNEMMKKALLEDPRVNECYKRLEHLQQVSGSFRFPAFALVFSLDIPPAEDEDVLLDPISLFDPMQRFLALTDALNELDEKKPLREWQFVKRFESGFAVAKTRSEEVRLTDEVFSIFDSIIGFKTRHQRSAFLQKMPLLASIYYQPSEPRLEDIIQESNREERNIGTRDMTLTLVSGTERVRFPSAAMMERVFVVVIAQDDTLTLMANSLVPGGVLSDWLTNWYLTRMKGCVVSGAKWPGLNLKFINLSTKSVTKCVAKAESDVRMIDRLHADLRPLFSSAPDELKQRFKEMSKKVGRRVCWI
jgi:hypothetical protein